MKPSLSILNSITVESPCTEAWNTMEQKGQCRHCKTCKENVYDLSKMTRKEVKQLIQLNGGRCCVRITKDEKGSVIFDDRTWLSRKIFPYLTMPIRTAMSILFTLLPATSYADSTQDRVIPQGEVDVELTHSSAICPPSGTEVRVVWKQPSGWFHPESLIAHSVKLVSCIPYKKSIVRASEQDAAAIQSALNHDRNQIEISQNTAPANPLDRGVIMGKMVAPKELR